MKGRDAEPEKSPSINPLQDARKLRAFENAVDVGYFEYNLDSQRLVWSDGMYRIYGVSKSSFTLTQASVHQLNHPDDLKTSEKFFADCINGCGAASTDIRVIRPGGQIGCVLIQAEYLPGDANEEALVLGTVIDVSEYRRVEAEHEGYRQIFNAISDNIVIYDTEYRVVDFNQASFKSYRDNLGIRHRDEVIGRYASDLTSDRFFKRHVEPGFERCLQGETICQEIKTRIPSGDFRYFDSVISPRIQGGNITGVVHSSRDITQRKEAEKTLLKSESRLQDAQDLANVGFMEFDLAAGESYWSDEIYRQIQVSSKELSAEWGSFDPYIHPDDADRIKTAAEAALANKEDLYAHYRIIRPSGEVRHLNIKGRFFCGDNNELLRFHCSQRDITEQVLAEEAQRRSEERYRDLYHNNPVVLFTLDGQGTILSVNSFGAQKLGYEVEELVGQPITRLLSDDEREDVSRSLMNHSVVTDQLRKMEFKQRHKNGEELWFRATARTVNDEDNVLKVLLVCEDISDAKILSEKLVYQASHDTLTGLINRREFDSRLKNALDDACRNCTEHAMLYIDLDQFKIVNDTSGHIAGDQLLLQLSGFIRDALRKTDTIARLGGDEFGVLIRCCTLEIAEGIAGKLLNAIDDFCFAWDGRGYKVGASIGLVRIDAHSGSTTEIMKRADAACYSAKDSGRNRVHVNHNDDTLEHRAGEMNWINKINEALQDDLFCLYAQPIVATDSVEFDMTSRCEILVRMKTDDGIIPPGAFLAAAERYQISTKIDRWVVSHTLQYLADHPACLEALSSCSINLSGLSMTDDSFLHYIVEKLESCQVPAHKICFEVTETAAITNLSSATNFISTLRDIGCCFALDDFGSGLSSFAYLKTLPVDYLKIDGFFVKDIATDPIDLAMVKSINEIGQLMGKKTIAEFVESQEIVDKLKEIGIDYLQGYHIGKPVPIAELLNAGSKNI